MGSPTSTHCRAPTPPTTARQRLAPTQPGYAPRQLHRRAALRRALFHQRPLSVTISSGTLARKPPHSPANQPAPAAAGALHTCDQRRAHSLSDGRLLLHHQNHKSGNQAVPIAPAATHTPLDPKQEHQPDALVCINHLDTPDDGAAQKQAPRMSTRPRLLAPMTGAPDGSL